MAVMKRQTLIAILFVIATFFTSVHELMPHHSVADCQVCTLSQNDHGLAPEVTFLISFCKPLFTTPPTLHSVIISTKISLDNPRAPPFS